MSIKNETKNRIIGWHSYMIDGSSAIFKGGKGHSQDDEHTGCNLSQVNFVKLTFSDWGYYADWVCLHPLK